MRTIFLATVGLLAETNLIKALAPDSVYQALVTMTNAVATQISAASLPSKLFVRVQVETAWGRLPPGPYQGIAQDLADFPFVDAVGLSSYLQSRSTVWCRRRPNRRDSSTVKRGYWTARRPKVCFS